MNANHVKQGSSMMVLSSKLDFLHCPVPTAPSTRDIKGPEIVNGGGGTHHARHQAVCGCACEKQTFWENLKCMQYLFAYQII